jgi:hypothetical protein
MKATVNNTNPVTAGKISIEMTQEEYETLKKAFLARPDTEKTCDAILDFIGLMPNKKG